MQAQCKKLLAKKKHAIEELQEELGAMAGVVKKANAEIREMKQMANKTLSKGSKNSAGGSKK